MLWESISGQHQCFSLSSVFSLCGPGQQAGDGGGSIYTPTSSTHQQDFSGRSSAHCWDFCQPEAGRGHAAGTHFTKVLQAVEPEHSLEKVSSSLARPGSDFSLCIISPVFLKRSTRSTEAVQPSSCRHILISCCPADASKLFPSTKNSQLFSPSPLPVPAGLSYRE